MEIKNTYRVAKSQWRKWNEKQRAVFNGVQADILHAGASLFLHPQTVARKISKAEFGTIAWNAAFVAADQVKHTGSLSEVITIGKAA